MKKEAIQQERDAIFSLLIYAIVYKDWQSANVPRDKRRGYNIGALLVNPKHQPVQYGLNCINATDNATQHGEVIAMTKYLEKERCFNLDGFSIYTTLEPCIMCAGMMTMTDVDRIVYGQHDVMFSKAFERLAIDSRDCGGYSPYPRQVIASASELSYCKKLDAAYEHFLAVEKEKILAKFLTSEVAEDIFAAATTFFLKLNIRHSANKIIYQQAIKFYHQT